MDLLSEDRIADLHKNMFSHCIAKHRHLSEVYGDKLYNDRADRYQLETYPVVYHRYFGMGHHLYVFLKDFNNESKINEVCGKKVNPRLMMTELEGIDCRLVVVDVEMGGMGVWLSEETNGSDRNS
jgi:hypothetical protein